MFCYVCSPLQEVLCLICAHSVTRGAMFNYEHIPSGETLCLSISTFHQIELCVPLNLDPTRNGCMFFYINIPPQRAMIVSIFHQGMLCFHLCPYSATEESTFHGKRCQYSITKCLICPCSRTRDQVFGKREMELGFRMTDRFRAMDIFALCEMLRICLVFFHATFLLPVIFCCLLSFL